jgi:Tfp pilus assembly protein PilV
MAMLMLNVGILAIVAAFSSGNSALARANRISTAGALANKQMEVYRGIKYDNIVFTTTEWNSAIADSTYTNDTVYQQNMANPTAPKALVGTVTNCPANVPTNACDPSYTTTGADHRSYRVDTYLYYDTPSYGNQLRTVTVVIRNPDDLTRTYSRVTSTFDPSIGGKLRTQGDGSVTVVDDGVVVVLPLLPLPLLLVPLPALLVVEPPGTPVPSGLKTSV